MPSDVTAVAFEELYRSTAKDVFTYVRRRTPVDAEDIVAEVYAVAWRRRMDLPAPMLRRAWLFGVARTLLLADHRRRTTEGVTVVEVATQAEPGAPAPDAAAPDIGVGGIVRDALARLSAPDQEVLRLVEWERLTPAELAVALGVRPGTARVRLHRARQALAADPAIAALVEPATTRGIFVNM